MGILLRIVATLLVAATATGGYVWLNYDWARFRFVVWTVEPAGPFDPALAPPAYNYASDASWFALPGRMGKPDPAYPAVPDQTVDRGVDIFFVNGTTYPGGDNWNQPPNDAKSNRELTGRLMPTAESLFGLCCNLFVPRYRQAAFVAFALEGPSSEKAKDLAYADVEKAFDQFIANENKGRPFIIAGYSQGAYHVLRLLQNRITGSELRNRMVAAYPMGYWVTVDELKSLASDVPVCASPTQTGCAVGYNAVGPNVIYIDPRMARSGVVCVNPLTWRADEVKGEAALNLGSLSPKTHKTVPGIADATCRDGQLVVSRIASDIYADTPPILGRENYHIIGMPLFFENIRQNMKARADAFRVAMGAP